MRNIIGLSVIVLAIFISSCAVEESSAPANSPAEQQVQSGTDGVPVPEDRAFLRPGPVEGGGFILPNGRLVTPAGTFAETYTFPNDVAVSPDGSTVVFGTGMKPAVSVYDVASGLVTQQITDGIGTTFTGIAFNASGDRFWVSAGAQHGIHEFDLSSGVAVLVRRIPVQGFPVGMVLSGDGDYLYTALHVNKRMVKIRISDGREEASWPAHLYPYDLAISADETRGYVSNLGRDLVSVYNLAVEEELAAIPVGANPEGLALSPDGGTLYVANSDSDDISVIDTTALEVSDTWSLHDDEILSNGAMPVAIDLAPDGSRLYVTCAGYDSIDVVNAADGSILGRIPTGWYPVNTAIDAGNGRMFVANGKGVGSHKIDHGTFWPGALQALDRLRRVERGEHALDLGLQRLAVGVAHARVGVARVLRQRRVAEHRLAEARELGLVLHGEEYGLAAARAVGAVRGDGGVECARARRRAAAVVGEVGGKAHPFAQRLEHGDVQGRAFASLRAAHQRGEDGGEGVHAGGDVGHRDARLRRCIWRAGDRKQPRLALHQQVVGLLRSVGAGRPVAGDAAPDEPRILGA